eukprot:scaffold72025_cov72-Phaeocystis_antarctica.AAC.3
MCLSRPHPPRPPHYIRSAVIARCTSSQSLANAQTHRHPETTVNCKCGQDSESAPTRPSAPSATAKSASPSATRTREL